MNLRKFGSSGSGVYVAFKLTRESDTNEYWFSKR